MHRSAADAQGEEGAGKDRPGARRDEARADAAAARMVARVRLLMVISGLTTLIAIAAVIGVIGYRVVHAGGSGTAAPAAATVTLPRGTRVIAATVADDRIVVTLDNGGKIEIRTFDLRTLQETGRIGFATEP